MVVLAVAATASGQLSELIPVGALGLFDKDGRLIGQIQSMDASTATIMFRLSKSTASTDVFLLRYTWVDRRNGGHGSEWLSPNNTLHDQLFFEGSNCTGRAFLDAPYTSTARAVAVAGDFVLWLGEMNAQKVTVTPRSTSVPGNVGTVTCSALSSPPTKPMYEVTASGKLDQIFSQPITVGMVPPERQRVVPH